MGTPSPTLEGFYLLNHTPQRRPDGKRTYKAQAAEIRATVLACPGVHELLESLLILNRWDVIVRLKDGVVAELLAQALENLDNFFPF